MEIRQGIIETDGKRFSFIMVEIESAPATPVQTIPVQTTPAIPVQTTPATPVNPKQKSTAKQSVPSGRKKTRRKKKIRFLGEDLEPTHLVSSTEAAEYFGVTSSSVHNWAKSGQLPSRRVGSLYKFEVQDVVAYGKTKGSVK